MFFNLMLTLIVTASAGKSYGVEIPEVVVQKTLCNPTKCFQVIYTNVPDKYFQSSKTLINPDETVLKALSLKK